MGRKAQREIGGRRLMSVRTFVREQTTIETDRRWAFAMGKANVSESILEEECNGGDWGKSNGEAEVTNRTILQGLKTGLTDAKRLWAEELQSVLWAYRTTYRIPTGETPFRLTYGIEVMIPVEIDLII
uniref:Uncharacterized protein LOC109505996 n=1 Tax=Elaeis guineensis var. tenera TaxID=51953 RepID=A0A6J0PL30_ELAGV|nr:uncharacterized protein LOC109505996 [Elaeis guineensis]